MMNKPKDIFANIIIILTLIFKLFIMATVLMFFSGIVNVFIFSTLIICGIAWTLGLQNINMIYYMLKK